MKNLKIGESAFAYQLNCGRIGETQFVERTQENCCKSLSALQEEIKELEEESDDPEDYDNCPIFKIVRIQ